MIQKNLEIGKKVSLGLVAKENFSDVENFKYYTLPEIKFFGSVNDGYDVIEFLTRIITLYPNKLLTINLVYEILKRESNLKYFSENIFRTLHIKNIGEIAIKEIDLFINEKGEIYVPEDKYLLGFKNITVIVTDLQTANNYSVNSLTRTLITGGKTCFTSQPCKHLLEALYIFKYNIMGETYKDMNMPLNARKDGYNTLTKFNDLSLETQINYVNTNKARKGSLFDCRIELIPKEYIHHCIPNSDMKTVYLYYDNGINLVMPTKITNLDLKQKAIMSRPLKYIHNTTFVFWDTEWNTNKDGGPTTVFLPDFLSYTVVDGNKLLKHGIDNYDFEGNTKYIIGKDCVKEFILRISKLSNEVNIKMKRNHNFVCLAHNASDIENRFILNAIATEIIKNYDNYKIELKHVTGTAIHSFYWGNIFFLDTKLFIPGALKDIANHLCKRYKKIDFDYETQMKHEDWLNPTELAIKYAIFDSISLAEAFMKANIEILEVCKEYIGYLGNISLATFSSGASFMKWFLTLDDVCDNVDDFKDALIGWDNTEITSLRDIIFMGGRCECGYLGTSEEFKKDNVLVKHKKFLNIPYSKESVNTAFCLSIDITSSYPHCMSSQPLPGKIINKGIFKNKQELQSIIDRNPDSIVYTYCNVKYIKEQALPLLGIKYNGKLVFPNFMSGTLSISMWDIEFNQIKDNIDESLEGEYIIFTKYYGFANKIKSFFNARKLAIERNEISKAYILKILMNSGYGSLALNPNREVAVLAKGKSIESSLRKYTNSTMMDGPGDFKWIIGKVRTEGNSMIFLASHITSLARLNLWKEGMYLIDSEGAFLLYRDTDSHKFVDCPSKKAYYEDKYGGTKNLGKWLLEASTADWEIAALKVYRLGNTVKYKGITGTSDELTKDGRIIRSIETTVWAKGRNGELVIRKMLKRMSFKYDKGNTPMGIGKGVVTPLIL